MARLNFKILNILKLVKTIGKSSKELVQIYYVYNNIIFEIQNKTDFVPK